MSSIRPASRQPATPQVLGKRRRGTDDNGLHTLRSNTSYVSSSDTSVRRLRSGKTYVTSPGLPVPFTAAVATRALQQGSWASMPTELLLSIALTQDSASFDAMRRTCLNWHGILTDKRSVMEHLAGQLPAHIMPDGMLGLRALNAQARSERGFARGLGGASTLGSRGFYVAGRTRDHVLYANRRGFELWQVGRNIGPVRRWQHTERWRQNAGLSQSGQRVIMGPQLGNVYFFDLASKGTPRMLWQPSYYVDGVAMRPQGDMGAWAFGSGPGGVKLWNFATNTAQTLNVQGHLRNLGFSPNGNRLIASDESALHVWDLPTTTPRTLRVSGAGDLAMSPDGRWLAGRVDLWNVALFDLDDLAVPPRMFADFKSPQREPKFSRDGSLLAFCAGPEIVVISDLGSETERAQRLTTGEWANPSVVDFAPAGRERLIAGNERLRTFQQRPNGDFEPLPGSDVLAKFTYWMPPVFSSDARYFTARSPLPYGYGDKGHSKKLKQFHFRA